MKTIKRILGTLLLLILVGTATMAQRLVVFSVDDTKYGQIFYTFSAIKDNLFDLSLSAVWTNNELVPIIDRYSVVGFDVSKLNVNSPHIKMVSPVAPNNLLLFNDNITLKFEVNEQFPGGEIKIDFPFFYCTSADIAIKPEWRSNFTFSRPKNYVANTSVEASKLIDKTPPSVTVINPEGVSEGLKPIIETDRVKITLDVTDFFGVSKVMINSIPARHVGGSTYEADLALRYGFETPIKIIAEDVSGLQTEKTFSIESRQPMQAGLGSASSLSDRMLTDSKDKHFTPSELTIDLPNLGVKNTNRYALIIGNEDYTSFQRGLKNESDVEFAIRDAETFKLYAINILGIPVDNIIFLKNATSIEMHRSINQINTLARLAEGKAEIFVMYAGHGYPDEKTQEPYLMPVDVSGSDLEFAIKLSYLYQKLTEHPTKRVTVFLDACFSGGGREQGLIAARAVKVSPRQNILSGNIVVFAAASGDQSALPWKDKQHGMFTYHLLNKLKETKGNVSYGELSEYLRTAVGTRSVIVNQKEQNPQTNISPNVEKVWRDWKIR